MVDWERNWRGNGVTSVVLFIVAWVIYGGQTKVGASAAELVSFYDGDRTRILIATVILGFAVLTLMWFATLHRDDRRSRVDRGGQCLPDADPFRGKRA